MNKLIEIIATILLVTLTNSSLYAQDLTKFLIPEGYCYGTYSANGEIYPYCYTRPTLSGSFFPFYKANRKYTLFTANRYAPNKKDRKVIVYSSQENRIEAIDSCLSINLRETEISYLGFENDTLYISDADGKNFMAKIYSQGMVPTTISTRKKQVLQLLYNAERDGYNYAFNEKYDIAYSQHDSNRIVIIRNDPDIKNTIKIPANMGGIVLSWIDNDKILYTDISVEGYGEFYYDLYVYDVVKQQSSLIKSHLMNVFDYREGTVIFESTPRNLCFGRLALGNKNQLIEEKHLDVNSSFSWIYSVYLLDNQNILIVGDGVRSECEYFKFTLPQ